MTNKSSKRYGVHTITIDDVTGRELAYPLGDVTDDLAEVERLVLEQGETLPDGWEARLERGESVEASGDCWVEVE